MAKIRYSVSSKKSNISGGIFNKKRGFAVGDTGPGGGIIFYVNSAGFAAGTTLSLTHNYLEMAPISGITSGEIGWSANTNTSISYQGNAIGTGYKATTAMIAQNSTAGYAGTYTRDYRGPNNLTDWYLGSGVEMNAMNTYTSNPFHVYWTSTQSNAELAQYKISGGTSGGNTYKSGTCFVRPIRSF